MRWPWREKRSAPGGEDYTQTLIALLTRGAAVETPDPAATSALESAAGLYGRSFAVADVAPPGPRTAWLTPDVLSHVARALIRSGESLWVIAVDGGEVRALPCSYWDVRGSTDPRDWWYRVDVAGPSGSVTRSVPAAAVLHFRYSWDPRAPWRGVSPLGWAGSAAKLSGALEANLGAEASGPAGHVLPVPEGARDLAGLKTDLDSLGGGLKLVETMQSGLGEGRAAAPAGDWVQRRLGADPSAALVELHSQAGANVLSACGVPPALLLPGEGAGQREAWRRFLHASLQPMAATIGTECRAKLEADVRFDFHKLFASDLASRARAFQSMINGGMDVSAAAALAGLMTGES